MHYLPSQWCRYGLLFLCLLAMFSLVESLADAVADWGNFGFAVTLWACFSVAYGWLLMEPAIRRILVNSQLSGQQKQFRIRHIGVELSRSSGVHFPYIYVYDGRTFDVNVSGIGRGVAILMCERVVQLDDDQLRSVLAHEFGHIRLKHGLIRLMIYGSLLSLAIIGHTMMIAVPANFFVLWTMRQMEFAADKEAVKMVGKESMRKALQSVASELGDPAAWQIVFSTHPSFRERILRL